MTARIHCIRQHPARDEVIIPIRRLEALERKERAHDDYLEAIQTTRMQSARISLPGLVTGDKFGDGYKAAIIDLSQAIVDAQARRLDVS